MKAVSDPRLFEDISLLDPVLNSDSWQTLMTFTRESARKSLTIYFLCQVILSVSLRVAVRPSSSAPAFGGMDDDIPPEVFDQIAADNAAGASSVGIRICPHCTFENTHGGTDCEVCGLPL